MNLRTFLTDTRAEHTDRVIKLAVALLVLAVVALIYKTGVERPADDASFGRPPDITCPRTQQPRTETRDGPAWRSSDDAMIYLIQTRFPDQGLQDYEAVVGTSRARYIERIATTTRTVVELRSTGTLFWKRWHVDAFTSCRPA